MSLRQCSQWRNILLRSNVQLPFNFRNFPHGSLQRPSRVLRVIINLLAVIEGSGRFSPGSLYLEYITTYVRVRVGVPNIIVTVRMVISIRTIRVLPVRVTAINRADDSTTYVLFVHSKVTSLNNDCRVIANASRHNIPYL